MEPLDLASLARRQRALDRARTRRFPWLFERKAGKRGASPLALLRGAAPLFYALAAERPALFAGPPGEGLLVGDAHLENVGAFRAARARGGEGDPGVVFDVNDLDEAFVGPLRFDVLRLVTSTLLAGRELKASAAASIEMAHALLEAHARVAFEGASVSPRPRPVEALVRQVEARDHASLLAARTEGRGEQRRFTRGARYASLDRATRAAVERAFEAYIAGLPAHERPTPEEARVLDVAFRVAGNGSLGALRAAVLAAGKGGDDGAWIFDLKELGAPAGAALATAPSLAGASRVEAAFTALLAARPRQLGVAPLGRRSMLARRLSPQEDKLVLSRVEPEDLAPLARHLGGLLGRAHRRGLAALGLRPPPARAWGTAARARLVDRAIELAAIHEGLALALAAAHR